MTYAPYLLAFTTGLIGGFGHCIGMCGPLVAAYAIHAGGNRSWHHAMLPHLLYNGGRITTYMAIGSVMGLAGSFLDIAARMAGIQHAAAIIAGVLMIVMGVSIVLFGRGLSALELHNSVIIKAAQAVSSDSSLLRFYPLGLLLGLMPCGLSYSAFIGSAAAGGLFQGMLFSLSFGLGTAPALLFFGMIVGYLAASVRTWIYRTGGMIVAATGCYFIFRELFHHA